MISTEKIANLALAGLTFAPLVIKVDSNVNVILTACLTMFICGLLSIRQTHSTFWQRYYHLSNGIYQSNGMKTSVSGSSHISVVCETCWPPFYSCCVLLTGISMMIIFNSYNLLLRTTSAASFVMYV
ncbi:hypothetical protein PIB30_079520 [Stylosanthes scabra]|uniref:Uncharacterized protein n=1 Tax=Stylosanthes scabra TaxID=79078 RepID=A0ABU6ZPW7_9FABA|nr:hypothetical protein [Stylosanthes scabra]